MRDSRFLGRVKHVLGATITVELDDSLAGISPIVAGRVHAVGQVGSLVRLPQGPVSLIASVTLVGISELSGPLAPSREATPGNRWLQVQLVGEIDALGVFHRGVSSYPALDDPVLLLLPDELGAILPPPGGTRVRIGRVSTGIAPVSLDIAALVTRHAAIVGSTGSGKSSSVALLVQQIARKWPRANVVVVDPHGEYESALGDVAIVRKVVSTTLERTLRIPYWALPAQDILTLAAGRIEGPNTGPRFAELVVDARRAFAAKASWVDVPSATIGAETPIPFDLRAVWHQLDREGHATFINKADPSTEQTDEPGDADALIPSTHLPYGPGGAPPSQGQRWNAYLTTPERMRVRLKDVALQFLFAPIVKEDFDRDPLPGAVNEWLGDDRPVSVLDFSGVPGDVADVAIGLVMRLIFEIASRSTTDGVGRARPVLFVLEEAHRYLGEGNSVRVARDAANRLAREGRKHGVGLLLVTQRPSELPDTALSQVGTIVALRLTNTADQSKLKSALPDAVAGLADALPALRTGEAIVSGEAVTLPVRTAIDLPDPVPSSSDPNLDGWKGDPKSNHVTAAVSRWRDALGG